MGGEVLGISDTRGDIVLASLTTGPDLLVLAICVDDDFLDQRIQIGNNPWGQTYTLHRVSFPVKSVALTPLFSFPVKSVALTPLFSRVKRQRNTRPSKDVRFSYSSFSCSAIFSAVSSKSSFSGGRLPT